MPHCQQQRFEDLHSQSQLSGKAKVSLQPKLVKGCFNFVYLDQFAEWTQRVTSDTQTKLSKVLEKPLEVTIRVWAWIQSVNKSSSLFMQRNDQRQHFDWKVRQRRHFYSRPIFLTLCLSKTLPLKMKGVFFSNASKSNLSARQSFHEIYSNVPWLNLWQSKAAVVAQRKSTHR